MSTESKARWRRKALLFPLTRRDPASMKIIIIMSRVMFVTPYVFVNKMSNVHSSRNTENFTTKMVLIL